MSDELQPRGNARSPGKSRRPLKAFLDDAKEAAARGLKSTVQWTQTEVTVIYEPVRQADNIDNAPSLPPAGPLLPGQRKANPWR